jgi:Protein UNC80
MLLECAHLVSRCNRGDWPHWMKLNLPGFCQTGLPQPLSHNRGQPSGYKRNLVLQKTTGRLFYQWAEVCIVRISNFASNTLREMYSEWSRNRCVIICRGAISFSFLAAAEFDALFLFILGLGYL